MNEEKERKAQSQSQSQAQSQAQAQAPLYDLNNYIEPKNTRSVLSNIKQMEYNIKYSKQLDFIKYIANKYNAGFRIQGSFNTPLFVEGKSDIDVQLYHNEPYVLYHKLKNDLKYRKLMQRKYYFDKYPEVKGATYKLNITYDEVDISFMICPKNQRMFFYEAMNYENIIMYYLGVIIWIIKMLYYKLNWISKRTYKKIKEYIFRIPIFNKPNIVFSDDILYEK